jgi:integrase
MANVSKRNSKRPWQVRYMDGGKKRSKAFEFKKDADAFKRKVEREIEDGTHTAASDARTIKVVCEEFIRFQEDRLRQGAIGRGRQKQIRLGIQYSILKQLGGTKASELTPVMVEDWYRDMIRGGLAPSTAKDRLATMNLMMRFAARRGYTKVNPVPEATTEIGRVARPRVRTFTVEQVMTVLRLAGTAKSRYGTHRGHHQTMCIVNIGAMCGMRIGEILGLTVANVNFEAGEIEVRHNLTVDGEHKGPKTAAGVRNVPMPAHVALMLRDHLQEYHVPNPRNFLFTAASGMPLGQANFRYHQWYPLLRRAGLWSDDGDHLHFHALRHFYASYAIENRMALPTVAALLGHAGVDMTLRTYTHALTDRNFQHQAIQAMASSLIDAPMIDAPLLIEAMPEPAKSAA